MLEHSLTSSLPGYTRNRIMAAHHSPQHLPLSPALSWSAVGTATGGVKVSLQCDGVTSVDNRSGETSGKILPLPWSSQVNLGSVIISQFNLPQNSFVGIKKWRRILCKVPWEKDRIKIWQINSSITQTAQDGATISVPFHKKRVIRIHVNTNIK